ncbi:proton-conducting transporter transmembrane domain-containing protein [Natronobacterium gregoryi]|uniref:Cation:proton antiporter n=2 Tax=Natronobacterium gregoryi TaxID=44930 RepID=L0AL76_NATGS|nr:proton-conducting transporter membrane subunit [Natronobacterium gregoryi]AFZ74194.1 formate hydrogenlyase subunit 3/multisubunit Na+/H+ antiporter, MnhD subunit [Natronobacterium gregoryi SP2]ELY63649.1 monovalent cation/H+ antiporter subunit D [Natronobacterium gregoryi SP2]PLK22016.1 cation:proton antiporter [Natronobacterium gregoryi SP2]SFI51236.1 multisubunit sodium/proton antiporter, MrpD subunit [Natronobacterium gregoryi]
MTDVIVASTSIEPSVRPAAVLLVPLITIGLIFLSKNRPNVREAWSLLAAVTMFGIVASMVPGVLEGQVYETDLGFFVAGIELALRADELGMLFALVASGLYVVTAIYSIGYMRGHHEPFQTRFFAMLCASVGAALGVAFASNLFVLLVFYEVLTLATYPLVAHDESEEARVSGYKYLAYALSGGLAIFGGMIAVFWLTDPSTITFTRGGIEGLADVAASDPWAARGAFALLAGGFAVKAGVMPLHSWLPSAMVAPTPVSGLLHAVAVVKAGAFGVARTVIDVFGPGTVADIGMGLPLSIAAGTTILVASLFALRQDNLKARLAYSTIAQLSYIVLGLSLLSQMGLMGGLLHIPAHAFSKLTLFLCAGALYVQLDVKYISEMAGVGKRMPITMSAFGLASFSMAGIPLLAGFVSKWHLIWGGAEAGYLLVVPLLVLSGVLNIGYFWPVVYTAFFESEDAADQKPVLDNPFGGAPGARAYRPDGGTKPEDEKGDDHHSHPDLPPADGWDRADWRGGETTLLMLVPLMTTATLMILFGIAPDYVVFFDLIEGIVDGAMEVSD